MNTAQVSHKTKMKFRLKDYKTENDIKKSGIRTAIDIGAGVLGGGFAGALMGRSSLLVGAVVSGAGYYINNPILPMVGMGMMASHSAANIKAISTTDEPVNGFDMQNEMSNAKARLIQFKDNLLAKTYIDKLQKAISTDETATTTEDSPQELLGLGMVSLDEVEQQLVSSALEFQSQQKPVTLQNDVYTPYQDDIDVEDTDFEEM